MSGEASPMELTRFVELLRASSSSVHIHRGRQKKKCARVLLIIAIVDEM
jgi:hypothetical protein